MLMRGLKDPFNYLTLYWLLGLILIFLDLNF